MVAMKGLWKNKKYQQKLSGNMKAKTSRASSSDKKFSFPPEEELKNLLKRVEQPGFRRVNIGLHPNATPAEKAKYKLCKDILRYKQENKLTTEDMAQKLELNIPKTEYILFSHIDKFHLDELINYADSLHLPFKLTINGLHASQKTTAEAH
jgi:predicted XRE-type DNA-binding protein